MASIPPRFVAPADFAIDPDGLVMFEAACEIAAATGLTFEQAVRTVERGLRHQEKLRENETRSPQTLLQAGVTGQFNTDNAAPPDGDRVVTVFVHGDVTPTFRK